MFVSTAIAGIVKAVGESGLCGGETATMAAKRVTMTVVLDTWPLVNFEAHK